MSSLLRLFVCAVLGFAFLIKANNESTNLRVEFDQYDQNNDGYLDAHELRLIGMDEEQITSLFDYYDADKDAVLTYEEFIDIDKQRRTQQQQNQDQ